MNERAVTWLWPRARSRQPSAQELEGAKVQGKRVAEIAARLHG